MAAELGFKLDQHRFLFSTLSPDLENSLSQKVESLHGRIVFPSKNVFSSQCTHVIAQEFSPTEKILGALAGGKWLLKISYILDSYRRGYWLNEEDYEYTDFNKVAAYHRSNWKLKNVGLYHGWKILVVMDSHRTARTFNRILAAGGAEIASKEDTEDVDFVITTKNNMKQAQSMVSYVVPLLDTTYIKETLLFKLDPADSRRFDLRDFNSEIPCKSAAATSYHSKSNHKTQGYYASPRKPTNKTSPAKRKQSCIQQTSMTQFLKPTIEEHSLKISKEKEGKSASEGKNLPVISSTTNFSWCNSELRPLVMQDVGDKPQSTTKTSRLQNAELVHDVEDEPQICETRRVQQTKAIQDVEDEPQIMETMKMQQTETMQDVEDEPQINETETMQDVEDEAQINETETMQDAEVEPQINETETMQDAEVEPQINGAETMQDVEDEAQINETETMQDAEDEPQINETETMQDVEDEPKINETSRMRQTETKSICKVHPFRLKECFIALKRLRDLSPDAMKLKKITRKFSKMEHSPTKPVLEESEGMCNAVMSPEIKKRAVPSMLHKRSSASFPELKKAGMTSFTMTKTQVQKALLNFIRIRGCLNEVSCTNLCLIPTENIKSGSCTRETVTQDESREMTQGEIRAYTCFISPELRYQELYVHGLDFLLSYISSYLYPPPAILGSLLRDLILETQSRIVHSRGLRVAYRVLSLHPPTTTKMRDYYLCVLEKAVQQNASGNSIAWCFIQRVIHCALEDSDETASSPVTQNKEGLDGAKKALNLLEFLITLIIEDMKNSPYGKAVQKLLTWNIFWGTSRAYNVVSSPVKKLFQLWISSDTSVVLRRSLAHLVTSVLELMWKLSGHPLVPVITIPGTLSAVEEEIQICCKGLSFEERLEIVRNLPHPWVRCIVSSIFLQEAIQCPRRLTLNSIVDLFYSANNNNKNNATHKPEYGKQVSNNLSPVAHRNFTSNINKRNLKGQDLLITQTKDGETGFGLAPTKHCTSRISPTKDCQKKYHTELLMTLASCYLEVSGNRYIYKTITKCVEENLKRVNSENEMDMDNDDLNVDTEKIRTHNQYLILTKNESLESLSDLEENAVVKMYKSIQDDREVRRKWSLLKSALVKKVDARLLFETLCL